MTSKVAGAVEWIRAALTPATVQYLAFHYMTADGNCFFEAVSVALRSANVTRSVQQLREVVARPVLDPDDAVVNNTLQSWWEVYRAAVDAKDADLLTEYRHMKRLPPDTTWPFDAPVRRTLYEAMLTTDYWAEQHAFRVLEEKTSIRFLIFVDATQKPALTWYHTAGFQPKFYVLLFLQNRHYWLVSFKGRFVFRWEELPHDLQAFFSQAYVTPKQ